MKLNANYIQFSPSIIFSIINSQWKLFLHLPMKLIPKKIQNYTSNSYVLVFLISVILFFFLQFGINWSTCQVFILLFCETLFILSTFKKRFMSTKSYSIKVILIKITVIQSFSSLLLCKILNINVGNYCSKIVGCYLLIV